MAKNGSIYECTECGGEHSKWVGQCSGCGEWNTLAEVPRAPVPGKRAGSYNAAAVRNLNPVPLDGQSPPRKRLKTGIPEFDRVLGGGAVCSSVLLLAGEPGIGKSTLLLQVCASLSGKNGCLYVSGEESVEQIRDRAQRLGVSQSPVMLENSSDADAIANLMLSPKAPGVVVVDSIQTMRTQSSESVPGSVSQVRQCAQMLCEAAKQSNCVLILVGHVTKENNIGGPQTLEHLVDGVFFVDAERANSYRILRARKNRFGSTEEIGVFEMMGDGLQEVPNPSAAFLSERRPGYPGSAVFPGIEGSRPVLLEVQALLATTEFSTPKRTIVGYDANRVSMILAVMSSLCGINLASMDIFINIAGGLKIKDPAADLAIMAALMSATGKIPCPEDTVYFGEIGLIGEVRQAHQYEARLKEAAKLGFATACAPAFKGVNGIKGQNIADVTHLVKSFI